MARVKANLFVSAWQGTIVVARAGEGLEDIDRVFRYLKEIVPLSCLSRNVGPRAVRHAALAIRRMAH